jgi:hypothetical protein
MAFISEIYDLPEWVAVQTLEGAESFMSIPKIINKMLQSGFLLTIPGTVVAYSIDNQRVSVENLLCEEFDIYFESQEMFGEKFKFRFKVDGSSVMMEKNLKCVNEIPEYVAYILS